MKLMVVDKATGVEGAYCIAKEEGGFRMLWNPSGWAGSGYVFTNKLIAELVADGLRYQEGAGEYKEVGVAVVYDSPCSDVDWIDGCPGHGVKLYVKG